MKRLQPCLAEFLGTFYLCFAGISAIVATTAPISSGAGLLGIALAHGLALSIAVSVFGGISGAHVNPAVTCGMLVTRRIEPVQALFYVIAQLAGATAAALAARSIFPAAAVQSAKLGIPLPPNLDILTAGAAANWPSTGVVLFTEFILTFLLVTSVFGTAVDERGKAVKIGGFGIGLTVTFDILAGGTVTGASMNPARSFGPALVLWYWDWHWCYWMAPIAGGCAAALIYEHLLLRDPPARRRV